MEVFAAFDLNDSGEISDEELLALGHTRRKLGQKSGEWNEEVNARHIKKMKRGGSGNVTADEFVAYYEDP